MTVTVHGTYLAADDGTPAAGNVQFRPIIVAVHDASDPAHLVVQAPVRADLDATGTFTVDLIASDDPGWRADGPVPYLVSVAVTGYYHQYEVILLEASDPIDLNDLLPLAESPDVGVLPVPGPEGPQGPAGPPGPQGPPGPADGIPGVWLSNITWPKVAAHRLGTTVYGEETMASAERVYAAGGRALDCDMIATSDGEPVLMHDATIDRTTNGSGNVSALTGAQIQQYRVDVAPQYGATGYTDQRIPLLDEVAARFRGRAVITVEPKTPGQAATWGPSWRRAGLTDTLLVAAWTRAECLTWQAQGFAAMLVSAVDLDPVAEYAAGIRWLCYEFTALGTAGEKNRITAAKAAGMRVSTYTHTRSDHAAAALAAGSDLPLCDRPITAARTSPLLTSAAFTGNMWPAQYPNTNAGFLPSISGGRAYLNSSGASEGGLIFEEIGPLPASLAGFTVTFRTPATMTTPANVWAAAALFTTPAYKEGNGYMVLSRGSGQMTLYRTTGASATQLANANLAALAPSTDYTITLTVTASQVQATRVDLAQTISSADTVYRSPWWPVIGLRQETANTIGVGPVSVTNT